MYVFMDALEAWGWWGGLSCCEGEQSTTLNYKVITHWVNNRLSSLFCPLLKHVSQRINPRQVLVTVTPKHVLLLEEECFSKPLQLGSWQFIIFKERAVFHPITATNPLELDSWQCSFSSQLYFSSVSASLSWFEEPLYPQLPVPALTHLDHCKFTECIALISCSAPFSPVLTLDRMEHLITNLCHGCGKSHVWKSAKTLQCQTLMICNPFWPQRCKEWSCRRVL